MMPLALPYDLIGRLTVALLAAISVIIGVIVLLILGIFVWIRSWRRLSDWIWKPYDPDEEYPPLWRFRISWVAVVLSRFKFRKIPAAYREATELAEEGPDKNDEKGGGSDV